MCYQITLNVKDIVFQETLDSTLLRMIKISISQRDVFRTLENIYDDPFMRK